MRRDSGRMRDVREAIDGADWQVAELRHDLILLRWSEEDAYDRLLEEVRKQPEVSRAFERWLGAHRRRECASERLAEARAREASRAWGSR